MSRHDYERDVRALADDALAAMQSGESADVTARRLVDARNALKQSYRAFDAPEDVARFEARNIALYGHPVGPTADVLFRKYGSWEAVIAAAARPGGRDLRSRL